MSFKSSLMVFCWLMLSMHAVFGQVVDPDRQRKEQQKVYDRQKEILDMAARAAENRVPQNIKPADIKIKRPSQTRPAIPPEEVKRIEKLRLPNAEDLDKYRSFLEESGTGMFKLFPFNDCNFKNIVYVSGSCVNAVPGSWTYSFRQKEYGDKDFFDLRLGEDSLFVDGFLTQGILAMLDETDLEKISLQSRGLKFLVDFMPASQISEAKKQFAELAGVVEADGYRYGKNGKIFLNRTYALRSIAYRLQDKVINGQAQTDSLKDGWRFPYTKFDKRTDVITVFRIIRQDTDGSLMILWKELQHRQAPQMIYPKNEKLSDIK